MTAPRLPPEAPGLRLFTFCLAATILLLAGVPAAPRLSGLLLLGWSFACLLRALWIAEMLFLAEKPDGKNGGKNREKPRMHLLPRIIIGEKNLRRRLDSGLAALRAGNDGLLLFLAAGIPLAGWALYLHLFPAPPGDFGAFLQRIETFMHDAGPARTGLSIPDRAGFLNGLSQILWIGLMVWACRSYACAGESAALLVKTLTACFLLLLGLCLMSGGMAGNPFDSPPLWAETGWGGFAAMEKAGFLPGARPSSFSVRATELGLRGTLLLYGPGLAALWAILRNTGRSERRKNHALAASGTLFSMLLADLLLADGSYAFALWLSGWSLTAALWGCAGTPRNGSAARHWH